MEKEFEKLFEEIRILVEFKEKFLMCIFELEWFLYYFLFLYKNVEKGLREI